MVIGSDEPLDNGEGLTCSFHFYLHAYSRTSIAIQLCSKQWSI